MIASGGLWVYLYGRTMAEVRCADSMLSLTYKFEPIDARCGLRSSPHLCYLDPVNDLRPIWPMPMMVRL